MTSSGATSPVPDIADVEMIGLAERARKLGNYLTVVEPGKAAFPKHSHRVNEDMFFILGGRGELRLREAVHPVRAGDAITCPAGVADTAHQLFNTDGIELKYLAVSTMAYPEVCEYPDSGKYMVRTGFAPDDFHAIGHSADSLDYWDGEV